MIFRSKFKHRYTSQHTVLDERKEVRRATTMIVRAISIAKSVRFRQWNHNQKSVNRNNRLSNRLAGKSDRSDQLLPVHCTSETAERRIRIEMTTPLSFSVYSHCRYALLVNIYLIWFVWKSSRLSNSNCCPKLTNSCENQFRWNFSFCWFCRTLEWTPIACNGLRATFFGSFPRISSSSFPSCERKAMQSDTQWECISRPFNAYPPTNKNLQFQHLFTTRSNKMTFSRTATLSLQTNNNESDSRCKSLRCSRWDHALIRSYAFPIAKVNTDLVLVLNGVDFLFDGFE